MAIRSLTSPEEQEILRKYASGRMVLEIGSYDGASALAMSEVAKKVHCVDPFREDRGTVGKIGPSVFRFINATDDRDNIILHKGRSIDVLPFFKDHSFGFVFIDGSHAEEAASFDIGSAIRIIGHKGGRHIALHDFRWPSVFKALGGFMHWLEVEEKFLDRLIVCRVR